MKRPMIGPRPSSTYPYASRTSASNELTKASNYSTASVASSEAARKPEARNTETKQTVSTSGSVSNRRPVTLQRTQDEEMTQRRELGLCYKCGERYSPSHVCRNKHFHMMIMEEEETEEGVVEAETLYEEDAAEAEVEVEMKNMELFMNSMAGLGGNHTMKLRGKLGQEEVIILIDSGATHNFIYEHMMVKAQLPSEEVSPYSVTVGDGFHFQRTTRCKDVRLQIQGFDVVQTFYPFPLKRVDAMLGIEWLKSLGEVKVNWGQL